ncbi:MAG: ABC transporter permease subunit [Anaerolineales bacterium]|nr:ABC transporter permease subunit [Anaerolineales bacterium]MCB0026289.1 ABC transporter permease subunit [Anaerolineales bacterium]
MLDFGNVLILSKKELYDARQNRWLALYTVAFASLSLGLAYLALAGAGSFGVAGFGRTSASLINLVLLIVPLMGLTLGALAIAGEREKGTLIYLMAQPITQLELLLGKFIGLALALGASLGIGFGLTAAVIALRGGSTTIGAYLLLMLLTMLLAIATLSLGLLISTAVQRGATAIGLALFFWLLLVYFGDLGLLGTALVLRLDVQQLFTITLANPLQLFKIAAIMGMGNNLEVLGPAGIYALRTYGSRLLPFLLGLLILWIGAPLSLAGLLFQRKGVL